MQGWGRSAGIMNSTLKGNVYKYSSNIEQIDLEKTVLNVFDKINAPVDVQYIEACRRVKSDDNGRINKVIVEFSKRKDMVRVMSKRKSLKKLA